MKTADFIDIDENAVPSTVKTYQKYPVATENLPP